MRQLSCILVALTGFSLIILFSKCTDSKVENKGGEGDFHIGWSSVNITPDSPVLIWGQRHARISEGILDSVTATALAIESGKGSSSKRTILISCDLAGILDRTRGEPDMYFTPGTEDNLLNIEYCY